MECILVNIGNILFCCALMLSGTAAYYSIAGLATIFASAFWPVVAMASILELSKLVVASWLYQKWNSVPILMKVYLTGAVIILMFITSLGIFGFLSKAHVDAGLGNVDITLKIEQIDSQILQSRDISARYQSQLTQLDKAINIQLDANHASQAMATRKDQEAERNNIRNKLDNEQKNIDNLLKEKTDLRQQISLIESKVGPIKYIAEFFADGKDADLDKAVRWMIVIIVMVFDPLAVLMLIAANASITHEQQEPINVTAESSVTKIPNMTPTIGQTMVNNATGRIVWWTGKNWDDLSNQESSVVNSVSDVEQPQPVQSVLDVNLIKSVVTETMDAWLTKALSDPTSTPNETQQNPDKIVNEIQQPAINKSVQTQSSKIKSKTLKTDIQPDVIDVSQKITEDINKAAPLIKEKTDGPTMDYDISNKVVDENNHILDHFKPAHLTYRQP